MPGEREGKRRWTILALPAFFALKVLSGLALLKISAAFLPVASFSVFSQFLLFSALLNMLSVGGAQTGLIRQIAAAGDDSDRARVRNAGLAIWTGAVVLLGVPSVAFASLIADFLTGDPGAWWVVPAIALPILAAGPGQIYCSMLTGLGRTPASLAAQSVGLLASTAGAVFGLARGDAALAVIAFSAGSLATLLVSGLMVRQHRLPRGTLGHVFAEVRILFGYSGAFAVLAILNAGIPFALRYGYREAFGAEQLGYWMAASRVSDTTTQLMALYLIQIFMPRYTAAHVQDGRKVLRESWLAATGIMVGFLILFYAASGLLVPLFLSQKFTPAVPFILGYMTGDLFRATVSVAMYAAFARAKLIRYVGLEAGTLGLFAAIMLLLIHFGRSDAPMIAYPAAYGACALAVWIAYAVGSVRRRTLRESSAPPAGG
ncbi:oligosaccharide flippase family protein [Sphingomonas crusticola]|uniref:oligosaccharide flippase family protein n=1 Tax=Sphingomonas crusticola TaxID=1697973 RepID=UPI000E27F513|nr:oligosaccharide flippase family protein [Sphingomonas crusticola]